MGSLSWSSEPSRPGETRDHSTPHHTRMNLPLLLLISLSLLSPSLQLQGGKSAVKYLGDTFLLPDGCPVDDPLVQRFYQLCLETRGGDTLCSTDRIPNGRSLTIPAFSNVCSAICHDMPAQDMKICPFKGEVLGQSPFGSEDGNGLRNSRQQIRSGGFSFNGFVQ